MANSERSASARILVVDDDPEVREAVCEAMRVEGHEVAGAADGVRALAAVSAWSPDALVLDVLMPGLDGLAVCRRLRALGDRVPILVLTARGSVSDRVDGLDAGADDYLAKPFALRELQARVRALLRRSLPEQPEPDQDRLRYADLRFDPVTRTGERAGRFLEFTHTEAALLELLLRNPEQVLTRELLMDRVWGEVFGPESNSLTVYIGYLRRKLEAEGSSRLVQTVHGVGYRLASS
ncbi:response regulator transcription factor [Catenulispora sp. NF23]|uniref:Response regulator transcription factor n=1 Tax=Catenulispora pinistramenti TaxID=2705254 RepID=A0ABS5KKB4_9ACTN|nr:response regulator transcription factor [Catenulispora pinistramenti]MBS2533904.1 response regulator transcription factor [Catenulispora pinistramenti]MBS2545886.1 response regulator transcription factor [Catenulispora pinistramenti]